MSPNAAPEMDPALFAAQLLNGVQLGVLLFLIAAGLTLVFGVVDMINLAHGSLYMAGAFFTAVFARLTGGDILASLLLAVLATAALGLLLELLVIRRLYTRNHLDQVLATFALILIFNEGVKILWGPVPAFLEPPGFLAGQVEIWDGFRYPAIRLAVIAVGLAVGVALWWLIQRTRFGRLIRAGADNRPMAVGLGVDVTRLFAAVFVLGAALAGLAGGLAGTIVAVQIGMGEEVLILAFVVIVVGGLGSTKGAVVAALLIGLADTLGRAYLPVLLALVVDSPAVADGMGGALGSVVIYLVMAAVLTLRPQGLYGTAARA